MNNLLVSSYSSSSSFSRWKYDVFLSFRGEDTRKNFISHLFDALIRESINVFKDDQEIERGKLIALELFQAIEESRFSIIIFSKSYASSTWCLDEVVKIVECMETMGQTIIPVFYHVDPSAVRNQTGDFREAFSKHEEAFKENIQKVETWRSALRKVANISGWDAKDRYESELIEEIVSKISRSRDVRMIGICGMGGIGKTTIAKVVYYLVSPEFEGSSFLGNVREISEKGEIVSLQKQLLSQTLRKTNINIWDDDSGICEIIRRLQHKKVLVVIDDVAHISQLNKLAGACDWFGSGSRIIITTRDESLLFFNGVEVYRVEELNDVDAIRLFSLKAFKHYQPPNDYVELSKRFVKHASGLPLALEVLGSFLLHKTVEEWEDALKRLNRDSAKEILDRLEISFHGLEESEKNIFLDVACFFKGKNKDYVTKILDGCGLNPFIGIKVLIDRSLITISMDTLWMHDMLQEMGQRIVKRESPKEPGKRSRLWEEADIRHVLSNNTGTELVECIMLNFPREEVHCSANAFSKLINLRLLKISNVRFSEGRLDYLSNELRLLDWNGCPLNSLPSNMLLNKAVELNLDCSYMKQPWNKIKPLNMLTSISFEDCQYLNKMPDLSCAPNLQTVILRGCERLCEIHPSLLLHGNITFLDMRSCTSLRSLPNKIHMKNLNRLQLSSCSKLKKFPEIVGRMDHLWDLDLHDTSIKDLPSSIEFFVGLCQLNLNDCKNLVSLPITVNALKSLETLSLTGCSKLENLPETLGQVESLRMLEASGTAIRQPKSFIFLMKNLHKLYFHECKGPPSSPSSLHSLINLVRRRSSDSKSFRLPSLSGLCSSLTTLVLSDCNLGEEAIPSDFFRSFPSLWSLQLSKNNFVYLPQSISHLSKLQYLYLNDCKRLQSVPELPSNIEYVNVNGCASLETLSNIVTLCNLNLSEISCVNCLKLISCNSITFSMLKEHLDKVVSSLSETFDMYEMRDEAMAMFSLVVPGSEIPEWFSNRSEGSSIRIKRPPYLCNNKLLGFVVGCVFGVEKHPPFSWDVDFLRTHSVSCASDADILSTSIPSIQFDEKFGRAVQDHLWLLHFPSDKLDEYENHIEFSFEEEGPALEMKMCGVLPVYVQDVEEFNKMINQARL